MTLNNTINMEDMKSVFEYKGNHGVWRHDPNFHPELIIKKIPNHMLKEEVVKKISKKKDFHKIIDHSNIVKMISMSEEAGSTFITCEFCNAGTLRQFVENSKGVLAIEDIQYIVREVAQAFIFLHSNDIIYLWSMDKILLSSETNSLRKAVKLTNCDICSFYKSNNGPGSIDYIQQIGNLLMELIKKPGITTTGFASYLDLPLDCLDFLNSCMIPPAKGRIGWDELITHPFINQPIKCIGEMNTIVGRKRGPDYFTYSLDLTIDHNLLGLGYGLKSVIMSGSTDKKCEQMEKEIEELQKEKKRREDELLRYKRDLQELNTRKGVEASPPKKVDDTLLHKNFKRWVKISGGRLNKVRFTEKYKEIRHVYTKKALNEGEEILFVPQSVLVDLNVAQKNPINKKVKPKINDLSHPVNSTFSVWILEELSNPESPYRPFLLTLFRNTYVFPPFFSEEDLKMIIGSPLVGRRETLMAQMKEDYNIICKAAPEFAKHSFGSFMDIRCKVNSSYFGYTSNGIKHNALVPLADYFHPTLEPNAGWDYDDTREGFVISANKNITANSEIRIFFGIKSNVRFLLFYGLTFPDNPHDTISIDYPKYTHPKMKSIIQDHRKEDAALLTKEINTDEFIKLMVVLRQNCCFPDKEYSEEEYMNMKALTDLSNFESFISVDNEIFVWEYIHSQCEQLLSVYPNTIQHDEEELKKFNLGYTQKNCLILTKGEKNVLNFYISLSETVLKILKGDHDGFSSESIENYNGDSAVLQMLLDYAKITSEQLRIFHSQLKLTFTNFNILVSLWEGYFSN